MKILVTGGAGFIGSNLCEWLSREAGHHVVSFDKVKPKEKFAHVDYYVVDLLKEELADYVASIAPDVIIHAAAQARVEPGYTDPIDTYRTNIQATINLLECALKEKRSVRFIYLSSETIYGDADSFPTKEQDHFRPDTAYAASKVASDVITQNCHGLKTVVVRSAMGYGPRSPPSQVVCKMFLKCMKGEPLLYPDNIPAKLHPTRDISYVQNFIDGVAALLKHPELIGVYNLGSGTETSILTLGSKIADLAGGRIEFTEKFSYRPHELGKRTFMDISKAKKDFGYNPRITLDEGLALTYTWLRSGGAEQFGWLS